MATAAAGLKRRAAAADHRGRAATQRTRRPSAALMTDGRARTPQNAPRSPADRPGRADRPQAAEDAHGPATAPEKPRLINPAADDRKPAETPVNAPQRAAGRAAGIWYTLPVPAAHGHGNTHGRRPNACRRTDRRPRSRTPCRSRRTRAQVPPKTVSERSQTRTPQKPPKTRTFRRIYPFSFIVENLCPQNHDFLSHKR